MNKEVAIHEAGHAVARLLTSYLMGRQPEDAVTSIEICRCEAQMNAFGTVQMTWAAICYGPMLSKGLQESVGDLRGRVSSTEELWRVIKSVDAEHERQITMRCNMLGDTMGAAAESRYFKQSSPIPLFSSFACEADWLGFQRYAAVAGIGDDRIVEVCTEFLLHAKDLVERPSVWRAINSIASELRHADQVMPGKRVYELGWPILSTDEEAFNVVLPANWRIGPQ